LQEEDRFASSQPEPEPRPTESQRLRSILAAKQPSEPSSQPSSLIEFTDENFIVEVLDVKDQLVVFDFWSESCILCKFMHEAMQQLQAETNSVKFGRVNTTRNHEIVRAFGIRAIPHLVAILKGDVVFEIIGSRSADELRKLISPFMSNQKI